MCTDAYCKTRPRVTCPYCSASACRVCTERYLLDNAIAPLCMWCKKTWSPAALDTLLTTKFRRGPLHVQRVAALMNHERTLLAPTQALAVRTRRRRDIAAAQLRMTQLRQALQVPAVEVLRVTAAPIDRLVMNLKEADGAGTMTAFIDRLATAQDARRLALCAAVNMRIKLGRAPFEVPPLEEIRRVARLFDDAATAMDDDAKRIVNSDACVNACRAVGLQTNRLHTLHGIVKEAATLRAIADGLEAITATELQTLDHTITQLVTLNVPPVDAALASIRRVRGAAATAAAEEEEGKDGIDADADAGADAGANNNDRRAIYMCKCPVVHCRGSIRRGEQQCEMCATVVCTHCHEAVLDAAHVCNANILANVRAIQADIARGDTKPCPSCLAPVSRTFGCNHMWCTQCHTAFDFSTGARIRGMFHNPEHAEWLQRHRVIAFVDATADACRDPASTNSWPVDATEHFARHMEAVATRLAQPLFAAATRTLRQRVMQLVSAHRCCVEVVQALPNVEYAAATYQKLRVAYLLGDINDAQWEAALVTAEGKRERNGHVRAALEVLLMVGAEVFGNIVAVQPTDEGTSLELVETVLDTALASMQTTREYVNEQLALIKTQMGGAAVQVDSAWTLNGK